MLDFVFFAIEAGAAIVLPGMLQRSDEDLFDVWHGQTRNFSRMFDEEWFLARMQEVCPQMTIYLPGEAELDGVKTLEGNRAPKSRREDFDAANSAMAFRASVDGWLVEQGVDDGTEKKVLVNLDRTMWEVDTYSPYLPPSLRLNFPMILRINPDIRRYAGLAMANMSAHYGVPLRVDDSLHEHAFYGAHLRTEADTVSAGWFAPPSAMEFGVDFEGQTDAYLRHAAENDLDFMYVATGNSSEFDRFVEKAAAVAPNLTLFSKYELLSTEDVGAVRRLEFDQQALIDLEILRRSSVFGGFAKSSFSFMIAVARRAWVEQRGGDLGRGWWMKEVEEGHVSFEDGLSRVVGRNELNERKCPRGCWP